MTPSTPIRGPCAAAPWMTTDGGAADDKAMPAPAGPRGPGEPRARSGAGPRRVSRSPHNRERLGRLRLELSKILTPPCNPEEAREEILKALARAGLGAWTLPALDDVGTQRCADGSLRLRLVAHEVVFNPWGAFRITDLHAPAVPYFESRGCRGRPFAVPPDR